MESRSQGFGGTFRRLQKGSSATRSTPTWNTFFPKKKIITHAVHLLNSFAHLPCCELSSMFSILPRLVDLPRVFFDSISDDESGTGKQMENRFGWYTHMNQTIQ